MGIAGAPSFAAEPLKYSVQPVAEKKIKQLPAGPLYWRVENFPTVEQAKAAVSRALHLLQPGDSFQLISFSINASRLGQAPLEATPENAEQGLQYLNSLRGEGGTMMIESRM